MLSAIHIHHWKSTKLAVICVLNSASVNVHACKIHALVKTPVKDHTVLQSYAEKKILERCADLAMQNIFKVCETDRQTFAQSLLHFKESLLTEEEKCQTPLQEDFITGFSYDLIELLCEDMEYIEDLPYLLENFPFFIVVMLNMHTVYCSLWT